MLNGNRVTSLSATSAESRLSAAKKQRLSNHRKTIFRRAQFGYIPGPLARVAEWQTRRTQNPVGATPCEFDSHLGHLLIGQQVKVDQEWPRKGPFACRVYSKCTCFSEKWILIAESDSDRRSGTSALKTTIPTPSVPRCCLCSLSHYSLRSRMLSVRLTICLGTIVTTFVLFGDRARGGDRGRPLGALARARRGFP